MILNSYFVLSARRKIRIICTYISYPVFVGMCMCFATLDKLDDILNLGHVFFIFTFTVLGMWYLDLDLDKVSHFKSVK